MEKNLLLLLLLLLKFNLLKTDGAIKIIHIYARVQSTISNNKSLIQIIAVVMKPTLGVPIQNIIDRKVLVTQF